MLVACESSNGWRPEAVTSGGVVAGGGGSAGCHCDHTQQDAAEGIWAKLQIIPGMSIIKIMAPGSLSIVHNPS